MRRCLDTNIIVEIMRGNMELAEKVKRVSEANGICITSITLAELYKGAFLSAVPDKSEKFVDNFASDFKVIDLDMVACKEFGRKFARLKKTGKLVGEMDIFIAAIAGSHGCILVTRNTKDFQNLGVAMEKW